MATLRDRQVHVSRLDEDQKSHAACDAPPLASALALAALLACRRLPARARGASRRAAPAPAPRRSWRRRPTWAGTSTSRGLGGSGETTILQQADQLKTTGLEARRLPADLARLGLVAGPARRQRADRRQPDPVAARHRLARDRCCTRTASSSASTPTPARPAAASTAACTATTSRTSTRSPSWGVDAIKVDWCGGAAQGLTPSTQYAQIHQAILNNASHRPMLLNICNFLQPGQGPTEPELRGLRVHLLLVRPVRRQQLAHRHRRRHARQRAVRQRAAQPRRRRDRRTAVAGPGHWNDPDYLAPDQGMNAAQFQTQFSMWAMLAAPLMISDDMLTMSSASLTALSNKQVIAIDQDPAGVQGWQIPGSAVRQRRGLEQAARRRQLRGRAAQPRLDRAADRDHRRPLAGMPPAPSYKRAQRLVGPALDDDRRARGDGRRRTRPCCSEVSRGLTLERSDPHDPRVRERRAATR